MTDIVALRSEQRSLANQIRIAELGGTIDREQRDPRAATQPLSYVSPGHPMVNEWDAGTAIRWAFYANVIVYRCVQIRANVVASLPFRAGLAMPERPGIVAPHNPNARLAQLLGPPPGGPAPKLSARRLWAWTAAQRIVTGRHGWEIETDDQDDVAALWPLTSQHLRAIPSTSGADWFSRFEYGLNHDPRTLKPDEIVYGWNPSMHDFRQPESALQAARLDVSIAVMGDRYSYAFLKNDARPAAVVVTEQFANDEQFNAFKQEFRGEYGGPDNAGKTAFVEATEGDATKAIDIKVLGLSQKDAQFMQTHVASLQRIAIALGVPWSKLDASGRTFDNASEENRSWWEDTILPDLADFADEVNMQLAPRVGPEVGWFDTSGVAALQPRRFFQEVGVPALLTSMLTTYNEGREMVGLPPIEGGDRFPTVEELQALKGVFPQELAAPVTPELDAPPPPAVEPAANVEPARAREVEVRVPSAEDVEQRRLRVWRTADSVVRVLETQWARRWQALFAKQEKATVARLTGKRGRQVVGEQRADIGGVFDPEHWRAESEELAAALYETVVAAGAARVSDLFGIAFDLEAEWAQALILARSNQLAGQVTDTTYRAIQETLAAGVAEGEDIPKLAERVRHVFDVASSQRATVIARTEVISAFNGSANLSAQQLPADVVGGREWIATRDGRVRAEHAAADGQVVDMRSPFSVAGEALEYPGDPNGSADNTVQCRCTVAFLTPEEMAERAGRSEQRAPVAALGVALVALANNADVSELQIRRTFREVAA